MRKCSVGSTLFVLLVGLSVVAAGCGDRMPLEMEGGAGGREGGGEPGLVSLSCRAEVKAREVFCESPETPASGGLNTARIVGGQGHFLRLASSGVAYDSAAGLFRADVTIENLLGQPMGTADGHTPHPEGIRVFHAAAPAVTGGSGSVSVANADGHDVFTASDQPYFAYAELLEPGARSAGRRWEWRVPASVESFAFTVYASVPLQHPDGWVEVAGEEIAGEVGDTASLVAIVRDFSGRIVDRPIAWETEDSAIAAITPSGQMRLLGRGWTHVVARSGAATPAELTVGTRGAPALDSIHPSVLSPGDTALFFGRELDGVEMVSLAGISATIIERASGRITVALPAGDLLPCRQEGPAELALLTGRDSLRMRHPLAAAYEFRDSEAAYRVLGDAESACLSLPGDGRYLVAATNVGRRATQRAHFSIEASDAGVSRSVSRASQPRPGFHRAAHLAAPSTHDARLRMSQSLLAHLPARRPVASGSVMAAAPAPGDVVPLRIPGWPDGDLCSEFTEVPARAVHVGDRIVVFEDMDNALHGRYDDHIAAVAQEFDDRQFPLLTSHFGDPFRLQGIRTPATGRIVVLVSARVNPVDVGFVSGGDLFDRATCAASNEREIVYLAAPTHPGDDLQQQTAARWARNIRGTLVHEVKHVISFANFIASGSKKPEERWLEEASANVATEIWAREHLPYGQGLHVGWDVVRCEQEVARPGCAETPAALLPHLHRLAEYHQKPGVRSPLGPVNAGDASYYGSGWSLLRWAIDHSGVDEPEFLRALLAESEAVGVDNLEARAGMEWERIVLEWGLASALGAAGEVPIAHPSWDVADILSGIAGIDAVASRLPERAFRQEGISVVGGSSVVFEVRGGSSRTFSLRRQQEGDPLVFAVLRVE